MCGIVGYVGMDQAAPVILCGLGKLEYRGYDSAGIAVHDGKKIHCAKTAGRVEELRKVTQGGEKLKGTAGIGHTRWATHGVADMVNAHPHFGGTGNVAVVHNGIIENYISLKKKLLEKGYCFVSETDTEVLAHLLDFYYDGNPLRTIVRALDAAEGSYALGILFSDRPGELYGIRKDSPLIAGQSTGACLLASDAAALLTHTRTVYYPQEGEILCLNGDGIQFFSEKCEPIQKTPVQIRWQPDRAEKNGFAHFMLKEIYEQPGAFADTVLALNGGKEGEREEWSRLEEKLPTVRKLYIVACGSALYAGLTGKYVIESLAGIPVETEAASEFRYRALWPENDSLVIVISQSGETADSLAALRECRRRGIPVLGIVNAVGSSIAREADFCLYTWAGPEIAVATTKAYSTQLAVLYFLAMRLAQTKKRLTEAEYENLKKVLLEIPEHMSLVLKEKDAVKNIAHRYLTSEKVFFIGRGMDYAVAMEGAMKLKEISYIHAQGYAAGELKHGTISLIEEGTLVAAILTQPTLYGKMLSNLREVKARGAKVFAVVCGSVPETRDIADDLLELPETDPRFAAALAVIPLQLFGYFIALERGCDIDKPRNLAKSVTVE